MNTFIWKWLRKYEMNKKEAAKLLNEKYDEALLYNLTRISAAQTLPNGFNILTMPLPSGERLAIAHNDKGHDFYIESALIKDKFYKVT
jgi:hypothetical protein